MTRKSTTFTESQPVAPLHNLLQRQITQHLHQPVLCLQDMQEFIKAIDAAYRQWDEDRSKLEQSLERSSEEISCANSEMRTMLRTSPHMFIRLDSAGTIVDAKAGTEGNFHLRVSQLFGKKIDDIPERAAAVKLGEAFTRLHEAKAPVVTEYMLPLLRGQSISQLGFHSFPMNRLLSLSETSRKQNKRRSPCARVRNNCARPKRWTPLDDWPGALHTISTT